MVSTGEGEPPSKKMRVSELLGVSMSPTPVVDVDVAALRPDGSWGAADAIQRQMPHDGVPLTILTGFLGAGKSTVLNYILRAEHGMRVAVLINEFGEVGIDGSLVGSADAGDEGGVAVLSNGCMCCTVSNGFIDAVQKILEREGPPPDYFVVETTGLADPKPIVDSVTATELREDLYVDQVLTVVDASAWDAEHYGSETAIKQIRVADTVLLSKTDLVSPDKVKVVVDSIIGLRPNARVLRSQKGHVPIAALFDLGMSLRPRAPPKAAVQPEKPTEKSAEKNGGEPCPDGAKCAHDHHDHHDKPGEHHEHKHECGEGCNHDHSDPKKNHLEEEGFSSISFVSKLPFSLRRFKDEFMDQLPPGVFRSKGLLWFTSYDCRFVFHWSGSRYNVEEDQWPEGVEPSNQLVIIGRELNSARITRMLQACVVRPGEESDEDEESLEGEEDATIEQRVDSLPEGKLGMPGDPGMSEEIGGEDGELPPIKQAEPARPEGVAPPPVQVPPMKQHDDGSAPDTTS